MKKSALAYVLPIMLLAGCGSNVYDLPSDSCAFDQFVFNNPAESGDTYMAFEYGGRVYVPYGTLANKLGKKDIDKCLGYMNNEYDSEDKNSRILSLKENPGKEYLVECYIDGFMDQPLFYRAVDTMGMDISTPDYIEDLEYSFWK